MNNSEGLISRIKVEMPSECTESLTHYPHLDSRVKQFYLILD